MNGESSGGEQLAEEQVKHGHVCRERKRLGLATKAISRKFVEKHVQSRMPTTRRKE